MRGERARKSPYRVCVCTLFINSGDETRGGDRRRRARSTSRRRVRAARLSSLTVSVRLSRARRRRLAPFAHKTVVVVVVGSLRAKNPSEKRRSLVRFPVRDRPTTDAGPIYYRPSGRHSFCPKRLQVVMRARTCVCVCDLTSALVFPAGRAKTLHFSLFLPRLTRVVNRHG